MITVKGDLVLVKVIPDEIVRESGLVLAKLKEETPYVGEIIALGDGVRALESYVDVSDPGDHNHLKVHSEIVKRPIREVKVGDKIIFPKWAGQEVMIEEDKYLFIREDHMLAIVDNED